MSDPEYALMSKRLGFRMLEDHDLQNLMRLDMNLELSRGCEYGMLPFFGHLAC